MVISISAFSQTKNVYRLKATSYSTTYLDQYGEYTFTSGWSDTSLVMVFNISAKTLIIYGNNSENTYELVNDPSSYKDDVFQYIRYPGSIDVDGHKCIIKIMTIQGGEIPERVTILIEYSNLIYSFNTYVDDDN